MTLGILLKPIKIKEQNAQRKGSQNMMKRDCLRLYINTNIFCYFDEEDTLLVSVGSPRCDLKKHLSVIHCTVMPDPNGSARSELARPDPNDSARPKWLGQTELARPDRSSSARPKWLGQTEMARPDRTSSVRPKWLGQLRPRNVAELRLGRGRADHELSSAWPRRVGKLDHHP